MDGTIDIIATDHAPHTAEEKSKHYLDAPSGLPLVQHSLNIMLEFYHKTKISLPQIVEKMCHNPSECFQIKDRGFLDEGSFADILLVDSDYEWEVRKDNILYKCGWSPLEGKTFKGKVVKTYINGSLAYDNGQLYKQGHGMRLEFNR